MNKTLKRLLCASAITGALTLGACTDPPGATQALQDAGYTHITITGYSWFGCDSSNDDLFATAFEATALNGVRVYGAVCSGWLKGYMIRIGGRL